MVAYIYAILILLLLLLLTIFVLLYASGLFENITVYRKSPPSCLSCGPTFLYKIPDGPYDQAGYLFTETASISPHRIQCGIHFEDEEQTEPARPRAAVGVLLTGDDDDNSACQDSFERAGFHVTRLPPMDEALVVSFPHTSLLSIPIGSRRVYRQLRAYTEDNDLTVSGYVELYDSDWIHYIGILADADRFRQAICPPPDGGSSVVAKPNGTGIGEEPVETLEAASLPDSASVLPMGDTPEENELTDSSNTDSGLDELDASFEKITTYPVPPTSQ